MVRPFRSTAIGLVLVALVFAVVGLTGAAASGGKGKHHGDHGHHGHGNLSITSEPFGTANGTAVERYTLDNGKGMVVKILTYGGTIQELWVPDRRGHSTSIGPRTGISPAGAAGRRTARVRDRRPQRCPGVRPR